MHGEKGIPENVHFSESLQADIQREMGSTLKDQVAPNGKKDQARILGEEIVGVQEELRVVTQEALRNPRVDFSKPDKIALSKNRKEASLARKKELEQAVDLIARLGSNMLDAGGRTELRKFYDSELANLAQRLVFQTEHRNKGLAKLQAEDPKVEKEYSETQATIAVLGERSKKARTRDPGGQEYEHLKKAIAVLEEAQAASPVGLLEQPRLMTQKEIKQKQGVRKLV